MKVDVYFSVVMLLLVIIGIMLMMGAIFVGIDTYPILRAVAGTLFMAALAYMFLENRDAVS